MPLIPHLCQINDVGIPHNPQESVRLAALRNDEMDLLRGRWLYLVKTPDCVAKILPLYTSSKLNLRNRDLVEEKGI